MEEVKWNLTNRTVRMGDSVMFDIDDTLIDSETGRTVKHIKKLLDLCKNWGYNIVIITARSGSPRSQEYTEAQLADHGIRYDYLAYCEPDLKSYLKQHLNRTKGWNFVLSVGDLDTDLTDSDMYLLVR